MWLVRARVGVTVEFGGNGHGVYAKGGLSTKYKILYVGDRVSYLMVLRFTKYYRKFHKARHLIFVDLTSGRDCTYMCNCVYT